MEVWGRNSVSALYEAAKTDKSAASELQHFRMVELAEEAAFSALLATMPTTKAGAVACVEHVAECGLATDEMRAWLGMLLDFAARGHTMICEICGTFKTAFGPSFFVSRSPHGDRARLGRVVFRPAWGFCVG